MGKSGSGKVRSYTLPTIKSIKGNIFFNGKNIQILKITGILKYHVSQNIFLFNSSILNNITMYERKNTIDKKLILVLKISNLDKTIKNENELKLLLSR